MLLKLPHCSASVHHKKLYFPPPTNSNGAKVIYFRRGILRDQLPKCTASPLENKPIPNKTVTYTGHGAGAHHRVVLRGGQGHIGLRALGGGVMPLL